MVMNIIKDVLKSEKPVKWLFYGDSITQGVVHTNGFRDYTQQFAERIRCELGRRQDIVINTAIFGNTSCDLLDDFEWRCAQFKPDILFIMIGMNDCADNRKPFISPEDFNLNLGKIVSFVREFNGITVLQTCNPVLPGAAPEREPYLSKYMDVVRKVAADENLPLVDHFCYWKKHGDKHYKWMSDAFHPNQYGQTVMAKYLYKVLNIADDNSQSNSFFTP